MDLSTTEASLLLIGAVLVGALPPLYGRWSDRGLHGFVAFAAGLFLGSLFLHLLPDLMAGAHGHGVADEEGFAPTSGPWVAALAGLLLLFFGEHIWARAHSGTDQHDVVWMATLLGLCVHAFVTGVALTPLLGPDSDGAMWPLLVSLAIHKASEAFSLATLMRLAGRSRGRIALMTLLFAVVTPAGLTLGATLLADVPQTGTLLTGFAVGTFLYVSVGNLLPEVFHQSEQQAVRVISLLVGIGVAALGMPHVA